MAGRRWVPGPVRRTRHRWITRTLRGFDRSRAVDLLAATFDPAWYVSFHGIAASEVDGDPLAHYLAVGARFAFSAVADFDELAYQQSKPGVAAAIVAGSVPSGYAYWLVTGGGVPPVMAEPPGSVLRGDIADAIRGGFDPDWYYAAYPDVALRAERAEHPSALWHYLVEGAASGRSPNEWFDEAWYLQANADIAQAKAAGEVLCGYAHYLAFGRAEGRVPSANATVDAAQVIDELAQPVGLFRLDSLERSLRPVRYRVVSAAGRSRVNVVLPTLQKNLLFAGYIAVLNFIRVLLDRGSAVQLIFTDDETCTRERLKLQFPPETLVGNLLDRVEIANVAARASLLEISTDDAFVAYSVWTAHHADSLARAVGKRFVFFIQEFEPAFHHHDSLHAISASMYGKPHFAIFNDEFLARHFRQHRLGVFAAGEQHGLANSLVFEHALSVPGSPTVSDLHRGDVRRLLFYARPEAHAGRNLFEIGVFALRAAIAAGAFDDSEWAFEGVGSLRTESSIPLARGRRLDIRPRLGLGDYAEALRGYDIGLSLQYTPHPGVVHFEMAASGMAVVTNTFSNRSAADLEAVSANLIPVAPEPDAIAEGLSRAVLRSLDLQACVRGAAGSFVTSWDESFNPRFMKAVEQELFGSE